MTHDNQKNASITFGTIAHPSRSAWPKHGCFANADKTSKDIFSVEAGASFIKHCVDDGELDGDQASALERKLVEAGLPKDLTRYDKLVGTFHGSEEYTRLVDRFCGQTPPEQGSGPARFVQCEDGKLCGLKNCGSYPPHVILLPDGIVAACGPMLFSREGAVKSLAAAVEDGLLLPEEAERLKAQTRNLSLSGSAEQADRFTSKVPRSIWGDHLDVVFGLKQTQKPARFASCKPGSRCTHLYCYDDHEIGIKVFSRFDADRLTKSAFEAGMLCKEDADRLNAMIPSLDLPVGSKEDSIYTKPAASIRMPGVFSAILVAFPADSDF